MNSIYPNQNTASPDSSEIDFLDAKLEYLQLHLGKNLNYFKSRADKLLKSVRKGLNSDSETLESLCKLTGCDIQSLPTAVRRKHILNFTAEEFGFSSWSKLKGWVDKVSKVDFSEFFCSRPFLGLTNIWFNIYSEAKTYQKANGGVLLYFKTQFFIANPDIIVLMGFERDDADWKTIGYDWVNPEDEIAKLRILEKILLRFSEE